MKIFKSDEFPPLLLSLFEPRKRKKGLRPKGYTGSYMDVVCAFDIETSHLPNDDQSWMYIWQFCIGDRFLIYGRTWDEFRVLVSNLCEYIPENCRWLIYVHNLSYEFQYLRGIYDFITEEVFCVKSRRVLKCTMYDKLEFRCSYLQTNMNLQQFTEKMHVQHKKLSGAEFDYRTVRYPWTELTERQLEYCFNDVIGLCEALNAEMKADGDDIYTIPLTSTGYVRRDAKKAMRYTRNGFVQEMLPTFEVYTMLREAFRGGNCHANRYFVADLYNDRTILENVQSADRSSSYPDIVCNCPFPISKFVKIEDATVSTVEDYIYKHKSPLLFRFGAKVSLRNPHEPAPYIPIAKCTYLGPHAPDNGRVLEADWLEMTVTDIDYMIIENQYILEDLEIYECYYSSYGYLPPQLIDTTISYYKAKTELKGIKEQEDFYNKSKNKLNSIYGMMAQDPAKQHYIYKNHDFVKDEEDKEIALQKYNAKAFLPYQWGVWVTAWARYRLQEGIDLAGDNFVYADTDSVKYIGEIDWTEFNNRRIQDSKRSGAYAVDPKGITHYMGVFEQEDSYSQFATMGAKKYVYTDDKGKLHVTISGVSKEKGGPELEKHGGIKAFKEGFIFVEAGGTEIAYIDEPLSDYMVIDGKKIELTPCATIKDSTYKLGVSADFERLLEQICEPDDEYIFTI